MLGEVLDLVAEARAATGPGTIVDTTLGGAGHAAAILEAHPDCTLVGIDRDAVALAAARERLAAHSNRVVTCRGRFDEISTLVAGADQAGPVTAVLFDLGVSSPQLDVAERGFSFRGDGPLDMRMDRRSELDAATVVNTYDAGRLARLVADYGDEPHARRIAKAIVAARPLVSTGELAQVVADSLPAAARRGPRHPARRTFQAIRIEVNNELEILGPALDDAISLVAPGGVVIVIAYHSGEDRIVKHTLARAETGGCECPSRLPCVCGAVRLVERPRRKPATPRSDELEANPRSSAARLRWARRLPEETQ